MRRDGVWWWQEEEGQEALVLSGLRPHKIGVLMIALEPRTQDLLIHNPRFVGIRLVTEHFENAGYHTYLKSQIPELLADLPAPWLYYGNQPVELFTDAPLNEIYSSEHFTVIKLAYELELVLQEEEYDEEDRSFTYRTVLRTPAKDWEQEIVIHQFHEVPRCHHLPTHHDALFIQLRSCKLDWLLDMSRSSAHLEHIVKNDRLVRWATMTDICGWLRAIWISANTYTIEGKPYTPMFSEEDLKQYWEAFPTKESRERAVAEYGVQRLFHDYIMPMMLTRKPSVAIEALRTLELLPIFFAPLCSCIGLKHGDCQNGQEVYSHAIMTCDAVSAGYEPRANLSPSVNSADTFVALRLVALMHDVGKSKTHKNTDGHITFYCHEVESSKIVYDWAGKMGLSREIRIYLSLMARHHMFHFEERTKIETIYRWFKKVENIVDDLFELRRADRLGTVTRAHKPPETEYMRRLALQIHQFRQEDHARATRDI